MGEGTIDEPIYHLTLADEWADVVASGHRYDRSTIDQTLDEVGFVHCALAHQVGGVVERYYADRDDIVVLTVDPGRLGTEVRFENTTGGTELFPHLYGAIELEAVLAVTPIAEFPAGPA